MENGSWTFLTNHAHVLLCISADHSMRLRELAERVGITERAAQRIVRDLCESGYLTRTRVGRRNQYAVNSQLPLRHPVEAASHVGALLALLEPTGAVHRTGG
ncbi:MAG TPA: winged helix-turn-helix domain-containing protein [Tepidiformaceae bacterium]|nr:winged helix-turn-helix domain-containing protein [Tepidiformaceae bacterium]